jgi:type II secretory pathway predicted ATPase ExeA
MIEKSFNTGGPCRAEWHYMVPSTSRLPEVMRLIQTAHYFVMHAPRQVGKTTSFIDLAQRLTESGEYAAVRVSCEVGAPFSDDAMLAQRQILGAWHRAAAMTLPPELAMPDAARAAETLHDGVQAWCQACPRPLVLFVDEIDALNGPALISVLRQLRDGHALRPKGFPVSLALIGMRDVKDYKLDSGGSQRLNTPSPFNVAVASLTMPYFSAEDVAMLYEQHTTETGQVFSTEAKALGYELSQGHPWLVNALANVAVTELVKDRSQPVEAAHILEAKNLIILRQHTHLDHLAERLREPRVRSIIEPMIAGRALGDVPEDDRRYMIDLGLLTRRNGALEIANPIYKEVIPRCLSSGASDSIQRMTPTWLTPSGDLDPSALLEALVSFWRQHGEPLLGTAPYQEIACQLVFLAWLSRVVNGGGTIDREYAIGRGRMDICVTYRSVKLAIELKVWRPKQKDPLEVGLAQLEGYMAGLGVEIGWLILFDRRSKKVPISERTTVETATTPSGKQVVVIRA